VYSAYMLHTSPKSILNPIPREGWYESFSVPITRTTLIGSKLNAKPTLVWSRVHF